MKKFIKSFFIQISKLNLNEEQKRLFNRIRFHYKNSNYDSFIFLLEDFLNEKSIKFTSKIKEKIRMVLIVLKNFLNKEDSKAIQEQDDFKKLIMEALKSFKFFLKKKNLKYKKSKLIKNIQDFFISPQKADRYDNFENFSFEKLKKENQEILEKEKEYIESNKLSGNLDHNEGFKSLDKNIDNSLLTDLKHVNRENFDFIKEEADYLPAKNKNFIQENPNYSENDKNTTNKFLNRMKSVILFKKLKEELKHRNYTDKIKLTYDLKYLFNSHPYRKYRKILNEAAFLIKKNNLNEALEYYYVILDQNLPHSVRLMLKKNIKDIENSLTRVTVRKNFLKRK